MKQLASIGSLAIIVCLGATAMAQETADHHDARALEVLRAMSQYKTSLGTAVITGTILADARLDAGLIVSNASELKVTIKRPASLHFWRFDGVDSRELYFHDGLLTVFGTEHDLYAQAEIPNEIDAALEFALEELEVEAPLMELVKSDPLSHLVEDADAVMYLTDKARIAGVDCHHIAIRMAEADVQVWVEEGDRPLVRRITITIKWEGGAPRFTADLTWESNPDIGDDAFRFRPPEGATQIEFVNAPGAGQ